MTSSSKLTPEQYKYLMYAVAGNRVKAITARGKQFSYLEQHDVRRTLIKVFGFGGYSADVLEQQMMFEREIPKPPDRDGNPREGTNWYVGYLVRLRLEIPQLGVTFTESAVGSSINPEQGDAHDAAVKIGASDALKRCAVNLGTQFGLSLYFSTVRDVVGKTLVEPDGYVADEQQKDDQGNDISDKDDSALTVPPADDPDVPAEIPAPTETAPPTDDAAAEQYIKALADAESVQVVMGIKNQIQAAGHANLMWDGKTLGKHCDQAVLEKGKANLGGRRKK